MQNILKTLSISRIWLTGLVFLFTVSASFAEDRGILTKHHVDSLKKNEGKLWYVDKFKGEKKTFRPKPKTSRGKNYLNEILLILASIFKVVVWIVVGLAVLGACYIIVRNLRGFKFMANPDVKASGSSMAEELSVETVKTQDLTSLIEQCIQEKNYRLAVRYYYLWIMKILSESNLIELNIDKTNQDYTRELRQRSAFSADRLKLFIKCTYYYEYLWFGEFAVSETTFLSIEKTFKDFLTKKA